jgi:hypothetical protein
MRRRSAASAYCFHFLQRRHTLSSEPFLLALCSDGLVARLHFEHAFGATPRRALVLMLWGTKRIQFIEVVLSQLDVQGVSRLLIQTASDHGIQLLPELANSVVEY